MSEALVWSIKGKKALLTYKENRQEAVGRSKIEGGFHWGCFHNGDARLEVVDNTHRSVLQECDRLTEAVSDMILKHMLQANIDKRQDAENLYSQGRHLLEVHGAPLPTPSANESKAPGKTDSRSRDPSIGGQRDVPSLQANSQIMVRHATRHEGSIPGFHEGSHYHSRDHEASSQSRQTSYLGEHWSSSRPSLAVSAPRSSLLGMCTVRTLYSFIQDKSATVYKGLMSKSLKTFLSAHPYLRRSLKMVKGINGVRDQVRTVFRPHELFISSCRTHKMDCGKSGYPTNVR